VFVRERGREKDRGKKEVEKGKREKEIEREESGGGV